MRRVCYKVVPPSPILSKRLVAVVSTAMSNVLFGGNNSQKVHYHPTERSDVPNSCSIKINPIAPDADRVLLDDDLLGIDPRTAEGYYRKGMLYIRSHGEIEAARNCFHKAIQLDRRNAHRICLSERGLFLPEDDVLLVGYRVEKLFFEKFKKNTILVTDSNGQIVLNFIDDYGNKKIMAISDLGYTEQPNGFLQEKNIINIREFLNIPDNIRVAVNKGLYQPLKLDVILLILKSYPDFDEKAYRQMSQDQYYSKMTVGDLLDILKIPNSKLTAVAVLAQEQLDCLPKNSSLKPSGLGA